MPYVPYWLVSGFYYSPWPGKPTAGQRSPNAPVSPFHRTAKLRQGTQWHSLPACPSPKPRLRSSTTTEPSHIVALRTASNLKGSWRMTQCKFLLGAIQILRCSARRRSDQRISWLELLHPYSLPTLIPAEPRIPSSDEQTSFNPAHAAAAVIGNPLWPTPSAGKHFTDLNRLGEGINNIYMVLHFGGETRQEENFRM